MPKHSIAHLILNLARFLRSMIAWRREMQHIGSTAATSPATRCVSHALPPLIAPVPAILQDAGEPPHPCVKAPHLELQYPALGLCIEQLELKNIIREIQQSTHSHFDWEHEALVC